MRLLFVILALETGCKQEAGACDPEKSPSLTWAASALGVVAQEKSLDVYPRDEFGAYVIVNSGRTDTPTAFVGYIYKCKAFRTDDRLIAALLSDLGWATADESKRKQLATSMTRYIGALSTAPENWDHVAKPFSPPRATIVGGSTVKVTYWFAEPLSVDEHTDELREIFTKYDVVFSEAGTIGAPERVDFAPARRH